MQDEEFNFSDMSHAPGANHKDSSYKLELNSKTARKLERLARLRIDPTLIQFPKRGPEFKGGYAIVSRALLYSAPNGKDKEVYLNTGNPKSSHHMAKLKGANRRQEAKERNDEAYHKDEGGVQGQGQESDDETFERPKVVAVKKMKVKTPNELLRVLGFTLREAEVLAGLSHGNIIKLEGFIEDMSKEVIWLIFPWGDNGTLKDFVALHDWEIPERISLIYDVTRGVEYLHTRTPPICHADLKSINILVNSKCNAVITDFGSAHHPPTNNLNTERKTTIKEPQAAPPVEAVFCTSTNTITLTGIQCTIRWAAPEVLENDEFSLASDIWALGWVAYEVMTNCIPFHDVKEPIVIHRVVRGDLPSISNDVRMMLTRELCSVMGWCWKTDSSKRPRAKDCRQSIEWMPKVIPDLGRAKNAESSVDRSAELLMELGHMHRRQSDYVNASKYYAEALDVYTDIGDRKGKANALVQLAQIHRLQQRYSQARSSYTKALEIYTELDDKQGTASALWGIASVHRLRGQYGAAIIYYSACLRIRTDAGDGRGRAEALWGLAEVHRLRNEYSQAVTFYSDSLQIDAEIGDTRGRASSLWGLAEVHRLRNEYDQAVASYLECLQIRTDIGDRRGRAAALWGLAEVHRVQNEYNQAVVFYSECLQIRTDIGDREGRAEALWGLASVHRVRNNHNQAITLYLECLKIRTDIGDKRGRAFALWGLAEVHRFRNEHSQAITLFSESLIAFTDLGNTYWRAVTLWGIAATHRGHQDHSSAIHHYEQAAQLFQQIGKSYEESLALKEATGLRQSSEQQKAS